MTKEEQDELLKEKRNLLSNIRGIARVHFFMTEQQLKPYEDMAARVVEIDELLKEAKMSIRKQVTDFPYVEITVRAYDTSPRGKNNQGLLTFIFDTTTVSDDDGKEVGFIGGGAGVTVIRKVDGPYFQILHEDLWNAIEEATEAKDEQTSY